MFASLVRFERKCNVWDNNRQNKHQYQPSMKYNEEVKELSNINGNKSYVSTVNSSGCNNPKQVDKVIKKLVFEDLHLLVIQDAACVALGKVKYINLINVKKVLAKRCVFLMH